VSKLELGPKHFSSHAAAWFIPLENCANIMSMKPSVRSESFRGMDIQGRWGEMRAMLSIVVAISLLPLLRLELEFESMMLV